MTINDPTSFSEQPEERLDEAFSEVFDLVDETVEQITDIEVDEQLRRVLKRAALDPTGQIDPNRIDLEHIAALELSGVTDALMDHKRDELLVCMLASAQEELVAARTEAIATRLAVQRAAAHAAAIIADAELRAKERTAEIIRGADAYVDTALGRAQEILEQAHTDAAQLMADAEQRAAEIAATGDRSPAATVDNTDSCGYSVGVLADGETQAGEAASGEPAAADRSECQDVLAEVYLYLDLECADERRSLIREHLSEIPSSLREHGIEQEVKALVARCCGTQLTPAEIKQRLRQKLAELVADSDTRHGVGGERYSG